MVKRSRKPSIVPSARRASSMSWTWSRDCMALRRCSVRSSIHFTGRPCRSEEHTSELQSQPNLVCRLLLEQKNAFVHLAASRKLSQSNTALRFFGAAYPTSQRLRRLLVGSGLFIVRGAEGVRRRRLVAPAP